MGPEAPVAPTVYGLHSLKTHIKYHKYLQIEDPILCASCLVCCFVFDGYTELSAPSYREVQGYFKNRYSVSKCWFILQTMLR